MHAMLVAPRTKLLPLDPLRMEPPVLVGEVVPLFALGAFKNDFFSWHIALL
jgi:hypothetical protein